ncbi:MAG: alanine--tRNA ligase [Blastochloris viridis]|uniref:Alanine--tRNA ligase n=1 Tax=Blastochloris viridis TaxID=1079 RepID=A0A6N4RE33_BLAVI|nr:MAG: alanine--tRNA ligase [Blastochloris viridis]
MMTGAEIRRSFLEHYRSKDHVIVPSSSLVPDNDPTLMFTNSGMVQFKNNFTGADTRLKRAASVQKSVRAGGKHNDLENVGHTARHHTFFEMMGNFSFGDYFKQESLVWGWEWVTEVLKIDPTRLCVTVYHDDDEAFDIWNKVIGLKKEDIIRIPTSDNFWTMGDTGPCGPCSEIFFDHGPSVYGGRPGTPEEDGDRFMEIWNHVFTQFDLQKDGTKVPLKNKNIDTGAGLERVMAVAQGVHSNYDTDVFQSIISAAAKMAGTEYRKDKDGDVSLRVIADHLRAMTFLMVDGVMPSNEGRGYVLRRIMRRAMRHGNLLGMDKPFIHNLVPTLVGVMGEAYPELQRGANMASDVIKMEEERFGRTLKQGMGLLDEATKSLKSGDTLDGEVIFKLYDTFGFPVDLTNDALKSKGIKLDEEGFQTHMEAQRARARASFKGSGDVKLSDVWFDVQEKTGTTEFLGYKVTSAEAVVKALVADNEQTEAIESGSKGIMVVSQTPFYAESGGQVGDTGTIAGEGFKGLVTDTHKVLDGVFIHHVTITEGRLCVGANVELQVDNARRDAIQRNHTATHIMFAALRDVLGDHVVQRGSRQDDQLTRFDISHPKAVTAEEIAKVEAWVNARIWQNLPVVTKVIDKDDAVKSGATAQFGEKYGDEVRVVYVGNPDSVNMVTADLCGGTHVSQTGEIGLFRITGESSVAAGIRRIEAVTHEAARQSYAAESDLLKSLALQLKTKATDLPERIKTLQTAGKQAAKASATVDTSSLLNKAEAYNGNAKLVVSEVNGADADALRAAVEDLKGRIGSGVVLLGSATEGKVSLVAGVTKDLSGTISAGDILKAACTAIGGRGGGKPELAMGGGSGDLATALSAGRAAL